MELTGKLEKILDPETGEGRNGSWKKQLFVVETLGNYPKKVAFAAWGDKADALSSLTIGQVVKVFFDPESREFNGKFYTDLKAWRIDLENGGGQNPNPNQGQGYNQNQSYNNNPQPVNNNPGNGAGYNDFNAPAGVDDDLPF